MPASTSGHDRYIKTLDEFEKILLSEPTGERAAVEERLLPEVAKIFPKASPLMCRGALRLITGFVRAMPDLTLQVIPGHVNLLMSYGWAATSPKKPEEAEGAGAFWLFRAGNGTLDAFENQAIPALSPFFHLNEYRPLAVRAWLRLQAVYFEPRQVEALLALWEANHINDDAPFFVPTEDFLPAAEEKMLAH